MKLLSFLVLVSVFGFSRTNTDDTKDAPVVPTVTATVGLCDGSTYTETMLITEAKNFEAKAQEMFGEELPWCEWQMANGDCKSRRATCAASLEAFCECVAEELELEETIPPCE